jgi:hypothetical protein
MFKYDPEKVRYFPGHPPGWPSAEGSQEEWTRAMKDTGEKTEAARGPTFDDLQSFRIVPPLSHISIEVCRAIAFSSGAPTHGWFLSNPAPSRIPHHERLRLLRTSF